MEGKERCAKFISFVIVGFAFVFLILTAYLLFVAKDERCSLVETIKYDSLEELKNLKVHTDKGLAFQFAGHLIYNANFSTNPIDEHKAKYINLNLKSVKTINDTSFEARYDCANVYFNQTIIVDKDNDRYFGQIEIELFKSCQINNQIINKCRVELIGSEMSAMAYRCDKQEYHICKLVDDDVKKRIPLVVFASRYIHFETHRKVDSSDTKFYQNPQECRQID